MAKMTLLMGIIIVLVFSFNTLVAENYDLRFVLVNNDATVGGNFDIKIQIQSVSGTFGMGTSNLVFTYNTSGLSNPTLLMAHNFSDGSYQTMTITEPVTGRVSSNIVLSSTNNGTLVSSTFMDVVTIRFNISDPDASSDMVWRTSSPNPTIVFVHDEATLASANELVGLDVSLPVELSLFTAEVIEGSIKLKWRTETETNNFGFNIYRSLQENGSYTQINTEIIQGAGTSTRAQSYSYKDHNVLMGNTYYYKLGDVNFSGDMKFHEPISVTLEAVPTNYLLEQSYPNPFNPETAINFSIKEAGKVSLKIYNLQGQLVRTLVDEDKYAGSYSVMWNGTNDQGARISSGTYLYTLKVNSFEDTKKMSFMK